MGYKMRRRTLATAAIAFLLSLAVVGQPSADAALIPSIPGPLFVPKFAGAPAVANPIPSFAVPQNPYMAPNGRNSIHNDAYATDSYVGSGPLGRKPIVKSAFYGVDECATMAFDPLNRIIGLCVQSTGPFLQLINPITLGIIGKYKLPGRDPLSGKNPLTDLCGGAYFYLDNNNRAVVATTARTIQVVAETGIGFALQHTYDVTSAVPDKDCLIALMPDFNGLIWFVSSKGVVGNVNPNTDVVRSITLTGEVIDNSFATDETGGVFIASTHAMYRFDAASDGTPVVTWRQTYDRGSVKKPGQLAQGTGTTPTLVGTDYVAITDNADPRMNVLVYRRSAASGGSLVCGAPVFAAGQSDTENSLVAVGNSLFVENNYGYTSPAATLFGATTKPGIARVDFTPSGQCTVPWTSNEVAPTSVPKASLANGLLYVYSKPKAVLVDAWYLTAIDMRTGKTAYSQLAGTGPGFNNHYAAIYLGPDNSAYVPTLTGLVRIKDSY